jgi:hypothetical protein
VQRRTASGRICPLPYVKSENDDERLLRKRVVSGDREEALEI